MRDNINAAIKSSNMTDTIIPTEIYVVFRNEQTRK